jgi:release factor glutamine methyltransferase
MTETLTIVELLKRTERFLASKGIPTPRLDAEILLTSLLHCRRIDLYLHFDRLIGAQLLDELRSLVVRRGQREPLQYIIGSVDWAGLHLKVDARALIPRPETEELLERVVAAYKAVLPNAILDLGTGSGALGLALKKSFPGAKVVATDSSAQALSLARENAASLKIDIDFREGVWFAPVAADERFELIVSNPPYLTASETSSAAPEVRAWEPLRALTSAEDGFADLSAVIKNAQAHLSSRGELWLEMGIAHAERMRALATELAYARVEIYKDLSGRNRFACLGK